jgi:hypothetical protein
MTYKAGIALLLVHWYTHSTIMLLTFVLCGETAVTAPSCNILSPLAMSRSKLCV